MTTKTQPKINIEASRCKASPTGAHHWMVGSPSATMAGQCKHCGKSREFHPFEDNIGFNNSPKKNRSAKARQDVLASEVA